MKNLFSIIHAPFQELAIQGNQVVVTIMFNHEDPYDVLNHLRKKSHPERLKDRKFYMLLCLKPEDKVQILMASYPDDATCVRLTELDLSRMKGIAKEIFQLNTTILEDLSTRTSLLVFDQPVKQVKRRIQYVSSKHYLTR